MASDILLIPIGTGLVVDVIRDVDRMAALSARTEVGGMVGDQWLKL